MPDPLAGWKAVFGGGADIAAGKSPAPAPSKPAAPLHTPATPIMPATGLRGSNYGKDINLPLEPKGKK